MKKTIMPQRLLVNAQSETWVTGHIYDPGDGLDKPTDRDRRSWVFLNDPKNCFGTNRKPKKVLFKKQNPKQYPQKQYSFCKSDA